MGLFDRLKKTQERKAEEKQAARAEEEKKEAASAKKTSSSKSAPKKPAKKVKTAAAAGDVVRIDRGLSSKLLLTPWVSEKAAQHADAGTYVFRVPISANKVEIQKAVESLWKVEVDSVRTIRGKGKVFQSRARRGKRANWKKALVTLKTGQTIDLYEGV